MSALRRAAGAVLELAGVLFVASALGGVVLKLDEAIHLLARLAP